MRPLLIPLCALIGVTQISTALGFDTVVSESSCRVEGFARPVRQTIMILDEAAVEPIAPGKVTEGNRRINRTVLTIAGVLEGQTATITAPRERLTVLFAREDGHDLVRAFTGCPPIYSPEEIDRMEKGTSGLQTQLWKFIGRDVRSQIEKEKLAFQSSLLQTMTELAKLRASRSEGQKTGSDGIGFLQALSFAGGAFDLAEGIPRIIFVSPMKLPISRSFADVKAAREQGFTLASKLGVDFQRAEVYVTGLSSEASKYTRDFAQTLFLGMKGRLAATSGDALPAFADWPISVSVFGGFIDYVGVKVPMQIRLAIDRSGSLVNSWMEVSVVRPVATPLTGKAICTAGTDEQCEITGDGKDFAQLWVTDVGPEPTFDPKLPLSGVRHFEFTVAGGSARGKVYDPNVLFSGKKEMSFELARTPAVKF